MDQLLNQALENIEQTLLLLSARVNPPEFVTVNNEQAFRYKEKYLHQAIIQKLARVASGLNAATILLNSGYLQELGSLQRMLDEFNEDIMFLSLGAIYGQTDLHNRYLEYFYLEEFDQNKSGKINKRPMIPRKKIRAYCANSQAGGSNPSRLLKAGAEISSTYSGYVHGASTHIMELYGGDPPKFHTKGLHGVHLVADHAEDIWNVFYRSILSCAIAAKAFGDDELLDRVRTYCDHFEIYWQKKFGERKVGDS